MSNNNLSYFSYRHHSVYEASASRLLERNHNYGTVDTPIPVRIITKNPSSLATIPENSPLNDEQPSQNSLCTKLCKSFSLLFKTSYPPNPQEATQNE